jgi:GH25 family lysozyme M1 (1,4-beta-N-acetylmuramidase)
VDQEDADGWKVKNGFQITKECISKLTSIMCAAIRKAGYHTGIYCSYSWLGYLDERCAFYDRWVAHWGTDDGTKQNDFSKISSLHQFTTKPLDRDFCSVDLNHFRFSQKQIA